VLDRIDDYEAADLSDLHKTVLRFTDVIVSNPFGMTDELKSALLSYLTPVEIVELALAVSQFRVFSSLVIALGMEPDAIPETWIL
jgi:alkylhydroperoxidase family enzyme